MNRKAAKCEALPKGWRRVRLREIASVKTGPFGAQLHQHDYVKSDGTPIVTVEHLSENGLVHENLPLVADHDKKRLFRFLVQEGDILFSRVGSVDRSSLVLKKEDGWLFSGRLLRVRPDNKIIDSRYLRYFFSTETFKHHMRSIAVGGTMPSLNTAILSNVKVSYPTLSQQRKMAELLHEWDTAIEKTERLIAAKEKQFRWLQHTLFTNVQRQCHSNHFLSAVCKIKTGKKDVNDGSPSGQYPFFTCAKEHTYSNTYSYDMEAILLAGNGYIGNPILFQGKFEAYQRTYILHDFHNVDPEYLNYFLRHSLQKKINREKQEGAMSYIKLRTLQSLNVLLPPSREQERIANTLNIIKQETDLLKQLVEKYRSQKRGLLQKLLTGEWRIKR